MTQGTLAERFMTIVATLIEVDGDCFRIHLFSVGDLRQAILQTLLSRE
jgi:hypothetical protein